MRVACPACDAVYQIPDQVLASGTRRLRCARCAHEWTPQPAAPQPAAQEPSARGTGAPDATAPVADAPVADVPVADVPYTDRGLMERVQRGEPVPSVPPPPMLAGAALMAAAAATAMPTGLVAAQDLPEPVIDSPLVASPPLIQDRRDAAEDRRSSVAVAAAWLASVAVLALLCGAAYVFRDAVQSAWPPSQVLYTALGLA